MVIEIVSSSLFVLFGISAILFWTFLLKSSNSLCSKKYDKYLNILITAVVVFGLLALQFHSLWIKTTKIEKDKVYDKIFSAYISDGQITVEERNNLYIYRSELDKVIVGNTKVIRHTIRKATNKILKETYYE